MAPEIPAHLRIFVIDKILDYGTLVLKCVGVVT